jgi:hypothetical protein
VLTDALKQAAKPALAVRMAPRDEMERKLDQLYAQMQMVAETPMWGWEEQWNEQTGAAVNFLSRAHDTVLPKWRYAPLVQLVPALTRAAEVTEYARAKRDAVLAAIALELYRRRNGNWPDSLGALSPDLLPEVPPDRHTGEPMKYTIRDGQRALLRRRRPRRR